MLPAFLVMIALATAPERPASPPLSVQVWDKYYDARTNMRYHLMEASHYKCLDTICRLAVLALSLVAIAGPKFGNKTKWQQNAWYLIGVIAFFIALMPLVHPYGDWSRDHAILASRWSEVADKLRPLYQQALKGNPEDVVVRMEALAVEMSAITKDEPQDRYKPYVMREAERAENNFQGIVGAANSGWWWLLDVGIPPCGFRSLYVLYVGIVSAIAGLIVWRRLCAKLPEPAKATEPAEPAST